MKPISFLCNTHPIAKVLAPIVLAGLFTGAVVAEPKLPEVSSDGLHLLKHGKAMVVYAKPGATLSKYTKVKILDCYVAFAKGWQRDYNLSDIGLQGRVTGKDAQRMKNRLAARFNEVFSAELAKKHHQVVDAVGPDVLLLRPALINVAVTAPDVMTAGMSRSWVTSAGSMTLYVELYDSATSTLLARIVDPRTDDQPGGMPASGVSNQAAADRILRLWADLLADHLGEVMGQTTAD